MEKVTLRLISFSHVSHILLSLIYYYLCKLFLLRGHRRMKVCAPSRIHLLATEKYKFWYYLQYDIYTAMNVDFTYFKYKLMIFLPHLVPYNTGQAPCRVIRSGSPVSWRLYQNIADPTVGLTPTPIRGKTVRPPAGTLFIYNFTYKERK